MNFKQHYHKLLMRFVLSKIEECSTAREVVKSLNILHAIRRTSQAWNEVTSDVIKNVSERLESSTKHSRLSADKKLKMIPFSI